MHRKKRTASLISQKGEAQKNVGYIMRTRRRADKKKTTSFNAAEKCKYSARHSPPPDEQALFRGSFQLSVDETPRNTAGPAKLLWPLPSCLCGQPGSSAVAYLTRFRLPELPRCLEQTLMRYREEQDDERQCKARIYKPSALESFVTKGTLSLSLCLKRLKTEVQKSEAICPVSPKDQRQENGQ